MYIFVDIKVIMTVRNHFFHVQIWCYGGLVQAIHVFG